MGVSRSIELKLARRLWGLLRQNPGIARTFLRGEYRRRWGIARDQRLRPSFSAPPISLSLNLTRRCNLKCRMCEQHRHVPEGRQELSWYDPRRELPLESWKNLLAQVAPFRPRLYLTGGEPLLYPEFPGFLEAAKELRLMVHLQTNGTRLPEMAHLLLDLGLDMVTVSLDGPPEINDLIRGQTGAFERSAAGIRALVEGRTRRRPGPLLLLNCVISRDNAEFLADMVPVALDLGVDILQFQHTMFTSQDLVARHNRCLSLEMAQKHGLDLVPPSIPDGEFYESEIGPEEFSLLLNSLKEARRRAQGRLKLGFLPDLPGHLLKPYYLDLGHPFSGGCAAPWKNCRILPDGTVSPCLHLVMGNIAEQPLREIWNGPRMQRFRELIGRGLLPGCVRCCSRSFG